MVRRIVVLLVILIFGFFWGCDFFIASSFPDYLPSVRNIANLDKYFDKSNPSDYDIFTIQNNSGDDYVFVLYKPQAGMRKVVVLDSDLSVQSEYENQNLGSLHTGYPMPAPTLAAIGSQEMMLNGSFTWNGEINTNLSNDKDHLIFYNEIGGFFYSLAWSDGFLYWAEYNNGDLSFNNSDSFDLDSSGEEYSIENACFSNNNTPDPADDRVILYVRRTSDGEGFAVGMDPNSFPPSGVNTFALETNPAYQFGKIKPGSVHIVFGGTGVVLERDDGTVELYEAFYDTGRGALYFNKRNETIGKQFKDRKVAYCLDKPDMYVFDPATKDLFECTAWWNDGF